MLNSSRLSSGEVADLRFKAKSTSSKDRQPSMKYQENPTGYIIVHKKKVSLPQIQGATVHSPHPLGLRNSLLLAHVGLGQGLPEESLSWGACCPCCLAQIFPSVKSNPLSGEVPGLLMVGTYWGHPEFLVHQSFPQHQVPNTL